MKTTNPCVYRLNDGNSVVFGSNADLKELDNQMTKARLQRGLPIDYDSFKVKSVKGNRLVLGNDKAVWVLPNQYIKSSKNSKNNNIKKSKRKLESIKLESNNDTSPSKIKKLGNGDISSLSLISTGTNSISSSILPNNYSSIATSKINSSSNHAKSKDKKIKYKNKHNIVRPKNENDKNISIPKVSVVFTSSCLKNSSMSNKIKNHMKNPNQKVVKIYNHSNLNGLKGGKVQADLSTVTMNKDNAALFAPLIENVCDQVTSLVMDNIINKMINKSIEVIVEEKKKNKNTNYSALNSPILNSSSSSSSFSSSLLNHLSSIPNHSFNHNR